MNKATWDQFEAILKELKVKPFVNVIHAGDASKPTGLMVRVLMDTKFNVKFDEPAVVEEPPTLKRGRRK